MRRKKNHRKHETHYYQIALSLWDGEKTFAEIKESINDFLGRFGIFVQLYNKKIQFDSHYNDWLKESVDHLLEIQWIDKKNQVYYLTSTGKKETQKVVRDLKKMSDSVERYSQPSMVAKITLGVHFFLVLIKLPAGFISGSIGLINDGIDTLLDAFSSILVYLGIRFNRERLSNFFLVLAMLITGGLASYQAIRRFFIPYQMEIDWFSFVAAILSALICAGLYFYQRYVGAKKQVGSIIAQSVDSRNHVIVAISVMAGLIAALLKFPLLDNIVGLVIALIILKSAYELALDLFHSLQGEEINFSRYQIKIIKLYEQFQEQQMTAFILHTIKENPTLKKETLIEKIQNKLDFQQNPHLEVIGMNTKAPTQEELNQLFSKLIEKGLVNEYYRPVLTPEGEKLLDESTNKAIFRKLNRYSH